MMQHEAIREQIHAFIVKAFPLARSRRVGVDDPLVESGIVDSLGVLNIVAFLERELAVTVSDEDLLPENFQTIDRLADFVRRKLVAAVDTTHDRNGTPGRS